MKKTRRKLELHRETLQRLTHGELGGIHGGKVATGDLCSVPSCIDGCPTVFTCPTETIEVD